MIKARRAAPVSASVPVVVLAVVGAVALGGMLVPASIGAMAPLWIVGGVALVLVGFVLLKQLGLGLALLPVVGFAIPFGAGTGTESRLVAAFILAAALLGRWTVRSVVDRHIWLAPSPIVMPTVALMLVWVVALAYGNAMMSPLVKIWATFPMVQAAQLAIVLVSSGILLLASTVGHDHRWIALATWSFLAASTVAIAAYYLRISILVDLFTNLGLVTTWVVALAAGQALANSQLSPWLRGGLLVLVALWMYRATVVQADWLSGWLPALCALAVVIALTSFRLAVLSCLAGFGIVALQFDRVYRAVVQSNVDEGSTTRIDIWLQAWDLLRQHLLLGTGPAGYAAYYMSLYVGSDSSKSTHSNLVDVAAQTGLLGFAIFCWFMVTLVVLGWLACRRWRTGFEAGFVRGALGGLVGVGVAMLLGDWFIPFVYNQTIVGFRYTIQSWVFLGFLVALAVARVDDTDSGGMQREAHTVPLDQNAEGAGFGDRRLSPHPAIGAVSETCVSDGSVGRCR